MEWISVKERLPDINETVLISDGQIISIASYGGNPDCDWFPHGVDSPGICDVDIRYDVKFWQPLPAPPAACNEQAIDDQKVCQLCPSCSSLLSNGGTCIPGFNSFVTACGGYTGKL